MLYILFAITILFLVLTLIVTKMDYFHPASIFYAVFLIQELFCIIFAKSYRIQLSVQTVLVLSLSFFIFFLILILSQILLKRSYDSSVGKLESIDIHPLFLLILLSLQVVIIIVFIRYLRTVTGLSDLSQMIGVYGTYLKFDAARLISFPRPSIYRLLEPVVNAASYIIIYTSMHNFIIKKKVHLLQTIIIGLHIFHSLLTGGRSEVFRMIIMAMVIYYVNVVVRNRQQSENLKFIFRVLSILLISIPVFLALLQFVGRNTGEQSAMTSIFIYVGAPLVNLNTMISTYGLDSFGTELFGKQTFRGIYYYFGQFFDIPHLMYQGLISIRTFQFAFDGRKLGNVYTTFYHFIYDLGIYGVSFTSIIAAYYNFTYRKIVLKASSSFSLRLFIFSYLFNDLVMLFFSNRFFETTLHINFMYFVIYSYFLSSLFIFRQFKIGRYLLTIKN